MNNKLPLPTTNPEYQDYHIERTVDLSAMPVSEREALFNTTASSVTVYEAEMWTTGKKNSAWFMCPVTGRMLPKTQGVKLRGIYYSKEAAEDIIADGGQYFEDDGSEFAHVEAMLHP